MDLVRCATDALIHPQPITAIVLCLTLLALIHHHHRRTRSALPLPPGPPGNILFGNTLPPALYVSSSLHASPNPLQRIPPLRNMDPTIRPRLLPPPRPHHHRRRRAHASRHRHHGARGRGDRRSAAQHLGWGDAQRGDEGLVDPRWGAVQEDAQVRFFFWSFIQKGVDEMSVGSDRIVSQSAAHPPPAQDSVDVRPDVDEECETACV